MVLTSTGLFEDDEDKWKSFDIMLVAPFADGLILLEGTGLLDEFIVIIVVIYVCIGQNDLFIAAAAVSK